MFKFINTSILKRKANQNYLNPGPLRTSKYLMEGSRVRHSIRDCHPLQLPTTEVAAAMLGRVGVEKRKKMSCHKRFILAMLLLRT